MGILNITPDSFSDGGRNLSGDDALANARIMAGEGADILDIGGESTRPGHAPVAADDEWRRVEPVLSRLQAASPALPPASIDTGKAAVARQALAAGASIVNDVWGFRRDPDLAAVTAETGAGAVLMHNREAIDPALDIMDDILRVLERSLMLARQAGIPDDRIALDPGIGFGKTHAQDFAALAGLSRLRELGRPILLGLSRKSLIGGLTDPARPTSERIGGTLAGNVFGVLAGADIIRVHDVAPHVQAMRMLQRIGAAG